MFQILSCGSNGCCQLGVGEGNDTDQNTLIPVYFESSNKIQHKPKKISCGGNHTLILFENGDLFASGDNTYGQCGSEQTESGIFKKISGKWLDVACGWEFSVLVNTNNQVFVCGKGSKGELGLGNSINETQLTEVFKASGDKIIKVKSCMNHTILQCDDELWGWGSCRKGQLGTIENGTKVLYTPTKLKFESVNISEITDYCLGREFTIIQTKSRLFKFGKFNVDSLPQLPNSLIGSMWSSFHVLAKDGTVRSFGNNSHGQLFPNNSPSITVEEMSLGSEHGLASSKNVIYTWGWGEHGNCGIQTKQTEDSVTFDYLNVLYNGSHKVVLIGAGCATSWVVIEID
ncbi:hypothetical protein JA1_003209 [Spathaspora sp. JA1]|nr:hypothetical protein JA1_003209 [Spathaspora sp. JA1]